MVDPNFVSSSDYIVFCTNRGITRAWIIFDYIDYITTKDLRSLALILKSILCGLKASHAFWRQKEAEQGEDVQTYHREDMHLSMPLRGIEAFSIVRTEDW
eukprot:818263_1